MHKKSDVEANAKKTKKLQNTIAQWIWNFQDGHSSFFVMLYLKKPKVG